MCLCRDLANQWDHWCKATASQNNHLASPGLFQSRQEAKPFFNGSPDNNTCCIRCISMLCLTVITERTAQFRITYPHPPTYPVYKDSQTGTFLLVPKKQDTDKLCTYEAWSVPSHRKMSNYTRKGWRLGREYRRQNMTHEFCCGNDAFLFTAHQQLRLPLWPKALDSHRLSKWTSHSASSTCKGPLFPFCWNICILFVFFQLGVTC